MYCVAPRTPFSTTWQSAQSVNTATRCSICGCHFTGYMERAYFAVVALSGSAQLSSGRGAALTGKQVMCKSAL